MAGLTIGGRAMAQPSLFDAGESLDASGSRRVGLPHSGTDTSRQAAFSMLPLMVAQVGQVLVFIVERCEFGATAFEIQDALKRTGDSERPRRYARQQRGLVKDSGQGRDSARGRKATVIVAIENPHAAKSLAVTSHEALQTQPANRARSPIRSALCGAAALRMAQRAVPDPSRNSQHNFADSAAFRSDRRIAQKRNG